MPAESIGSILLDLGINQKQFNKQLTGISNTANRKVGVAFAGLGKIIAGAFAVKKLYDFGKASISLASDLEEVGNVVSVVFGTMTDQVNNFASTALEQFGMSRLSALKYSSTMGAMLTSTGLAQEKTTQMSTAIAGLVGDMASFYNLDHDTAYQKISSGLAGEIEPLRRLGINMSVANMEAFALQKGIGEAWSEMSSANQTLLRYEYLMEKTAMAQGDFARTSDSWANQTRLLSERFKEMQLTLGQGFINVLTPTIRMINTLISKLQTAANYFKAFTEVVMGVSEQDAADQVNATSEAVSDLGDSVVEAGKKTKDSLSVFDELNLIGGSEVGGTSLDSGLASDTDTPGLLGGSAEVEAEASSLDAFKVKLESIKLSISGILGQIKAEFATILEPMIKPFEEWKQSVAELFNDIYVSYIQPGIDFWLGAFNDMWTSITKFWDDHGANIIQSVAKFVLEITEWFTAMWNNYLKPIVTSMWENMNWLWDNYLSDIVSLVLDFVGNVVEAFMAIVNNALLPLLTWWSNTFGPQFASIMELVQDLFFSLLGAVLGVVEGIMHIFNGLANFIAGIFTGDMERAFGGIAEIIGGIFIGIVEVVKGAINAMIDLVNFAIRKINTVNVDIPDWIPELGGKSFGINIPQITKLAKGGLAYGPTLAMVGDNKGAASDPEVISPLSKLESMLENSGGNQEMVTLLRGILEAVQGLDFEASVSDVEFGKMAYSAIKKYKRQLGLS